MFGPNEFIVHEPGLLPALSKSAYQKAVDTRRANLKAKAAMAAQAAAK
jgi:hypothetical protein